jgi:hypothetical protein
VRVRRSAFRASGTRRESAKNQPSQCHEDDVVDLVEFGIEVRAPSHGTLAAGMVRPYAPWLPLPAARRRG